MDCQTFDPVRFAFGDPLVPAARAHLEMCALCAEEVADLPALLQQAPLGAELAAAFGGAPPEAAAVLPVRPRRPALPLQAEEVVPLLADEVSTGGSFTRFDALEADAAPGPGVRLRLTVALPQGQLVPLGMAVRVRYALDEDAEVLVVHRTGTREVQLLFPTSTTPDPFWRAGAASFTGIIEGRHGERQQFVLLATKARVLPAPIPFGDAPRLGAMYREAVAQARALPQDHWCEAVLPYTAVDLQVVEAYRRLDDVTALEAACLREIHNKQDWAKAACGEVCRRLLTTLAAEPQPAADAIPSLFRAITEKLLRYWVGHWRGTWEEPVLQDAVQEVYAQFFQTARRHPLAFTGTLEPVSGPPVQLPCYTALLAFLKTITLRVVFAEWRQQQRAAIHTFLRLMHQAAPQLAAAEKALFQTWTDAHVCENAVEQALFAGVLAGTKPRQLLEHPAVQAAFGHANKQLANARDALLRRVYKALRRQPPPELLPLLEHLLAEVHGGRAAHNEDDVDDADV